MGRREKQLECLFDVIDRFFCQGAHFCRDFYFWQHRHPFSSSRKSTPTALPFRARDELNTSIF
jgi:hypothetical protein